MKHKGTKYKTEETSIFSVTLEMLYVSMEYREFC